MHNVFELKHPLVLHHLTRLRDQRTTPEAFRALVRRMTMLLSYEATKDLKLRPIEVQTPMAMTEGQQVAQRVGLVPILRAGLGMVEAVLDLMPSSEVWHLGFYRDEKTLKPVEYYKKLPGADPVDVALVLDPMLATGGSAVAALGAVHDWGVKNIKLLSLIAAPEGVDAVHKEFPDVQIYLCAMDSHLNDQAYIIPGLGDAGDRIFNAQAT